MVRHPFPYFSALKKAKAAMMGGEVGCGCNIQNKRFISMRISG
jgi:hypothetical protein